MQGRHFTPLLTLCFQQGRASMSFLFSETLPFLKFLLFSSSVHEIFQLLTGRTFYVKKMIMNNSTILLLNVSFFFFFFFSLYLDGLSSLISSHSELINSEI
jgi:hypothetical protein